MTSDILISVIVLLSVLLAVWFLSRVWSVFRMFNDLNDLMHNYLICKVLDLKQELHQKVFEDPDAVTEEIIEARYKYFAREYDYQKIFTTLIPFSFRSVVFSFSDIRQFINQKMLKNMLSTVAGREEEILDIVRVASNSLHSEIAQ